MEIAVTPNGEGTEENPYQITSINNLLWISHEAEKNNTDCQFYKMMNNIDASDTYNWNNGAGFRPIGQDYDNAFKGTFDGNGKKITNLYINRTSSSGRLYVGLFGLTSHSTIKNLELKNVNISCAVSTDKFYLIDYIIPYVGGLVGLNHGTIINCTISGVVIGDGSGSYTNIGGLVGENTGTITDCTASASVTSTSTGGCPHTATHAGGLVGKNNGAIAFCTASGNVIGANISRMAHTHIGGLIGYNSSTITNCTALGNVTGTNISRCAHTYLGGLIGSNNGTIAECISSGNAASKHTSTDKNYYPKTYVGGLIGFNYGPITKCTALGNVTGSWLGETNQRNDSIFVGGLVGQNLRSKIDRCYSVGLVSSDYTDNVGGLIGMNERGSVVSSFWDMNTSGQETSSGGIGKTTEKMKRWVTYSK